MSKISTALTQLRTDRGEFMASIVSHFFRWLPDATYLKLLYRFKMGHRLDLHNPKTFTEKLQWLKLYNRKPEYTTMVDKYAVKEYVAGIIGEQYIIPTLGVWDKPEQIDWDSLPDKFVLKTTHGGGGGGVVICRDKATFDRQAAISRLNQSLSSDIYRGLREWPYKDVPKRIIAEQFMAPVKACAPKDLPDYKFFCFNGEPRYCQVIRDRHSKETIDFYDMDWAHQEFVGLNPVARNDLNPIIRNGLTPVARPENLEEMAEICRKLAKDEPFVRVDLYVIDNKKYFGELTFYPASGMGVFTPEEWNGRLGDLLTLPNAIGGGKYLITDEQITDLAKSSDLLDYKFFCFDGEPRFLYVSDSPSHSLAFLNTDWTRADFGRDDYHPLDNLPDKPENLEEMLGLARQLSAGKPHVRVDLYNLDKNIYFGELTLYTGSGFIPFNPKEYDGRLGDLLTLPNAMGGVNT